MAVTTLTVITDDIDGSKDASTISFAFGGTNYEVDLSEKHAEALAKALAPYIEAGRKVRTGSTAPARRSSSVGGVDPKAVRKWAESAGITVSSRGRIPADIVEKFKAEGN